MTGVITVEPAPSLRVEFARWGTDFGPRFRTCSHNEFEVPADLFSEAPEELLIGAIVDGHRYRSPIEDDQLGITPPGTWPGPEEAPTFAPPGTTAADDGSAHVCADCGKPAASAAGLAAHRRSKHPEE